MADTARIKGTAFREFLAFYAATRGEDKLRQRASAIEAALREELFVDQPVLGVLTSQWYSAAVVHRLLDELTSGLSEAERRLLATESSQAVMDATLHGFYKVLFKWMATPERYASYAPRLWGLYYDTGSFDVQYAPGATTAVSVVRDWAAHHPFICELNRGAAIAIYSAMDCKAVQCERTACVASGHSECRFVIRWNA